MLVSEPLPGTRHGRVALHVGALLDAHVRRGRLGVVLSNDSGFILARSPDTVRGPDVAFVSRKRYDSVQDLVRAFPGSPDLAVEVLSPSNTPAAIHAKVGDYLAAGTRCVWVIDPEDETVAVYRSLLSPRVLTETDALEGEDVVPGFAKGLGLFGSDNGRAASWNRRIFCLAARGALDIPSSSRPWQRSPVDGPGPPGERNPALSTRRTAPRARQGQTEMDEGSSLLSHDRQGDPLPDRDRRPRGADPDGTGDLRDRGHEHPVLAVPGLPPELAAARSGPARRSPSRRGATHARSTPSIGRATPGPASARRITTSGVAIARKGARRRSGFIRPTRTSSSRGSPTAASGRRRTAERPGRRSAISR